MSQYIVTVKYTPENSFSKGIEKFRINGGSEEAAKFIVENSMYFQNLQDAEVIRVRLARYLKK